MTPLLGAWLRNGSELPERVAARQFTLQPRNLALQVRHSFLTLTEVRIFDSGTWRAPVLGLVGTHVGCSVPLHGYAPVTGYAGSVTTGYVTR